MSTPPPNLDPIIRACQPSELEALATLAARIWQHHYPGIISQAQIDYMLAQRYSLPTLAAESSTAGHWLDGLWLDGQLVGFANYFLLSPTRMKLDKLYLDPAWHGRGLGSLLLQYVAARSRQQGCEWLQLAVNKHNRLAIRAYQRNGFVIAESVCQDIGNGFVMDDYLMQLPL